MSKADTERALEAERQARRYRNALVEILAECHEREFFSEGQLAAITGLDIVGVRAMLDLSRVDEAPMPADENELVTTRVLYGKTREALVRLMADGAERSTSEVARHLNVSSDAAVHALRRCNAVERIRRGTWRLKAKVSA